MWLISGFVRSLVPCGLFETGHGGEDVVRANGWDKVLYPADVTTENASINCMKSYFYRLL